MRIAELSRRSGRSVPTIKYYIREGLLPPGERTVANQADYGESHLHRLRFITTLVEIGKLPIVTIRSLVAALDDAALPLHEVLGIAHHGLAPGARERAGPDLATPAGEIDAFVSGLGWRVKEDAPAKRELAEALMSLRELGWNVGPEVFTRYASAADELAAWELTRVPTGASRAEVVEAVVVGTVVFEAALVALRRLAEEHHSARTFSPQPAGRRRRTRAQ